MKEKWLEGSGQAARWNKNASTRGFLAGGRRAGCQEDEEIKGAELDDSGPDEDRSLGGGACSHTQERIRRRLRSK